jgi:smad nuclear-interacting protein 1
LAAVTNLKNGTVLKYNEPPEAKKTKGWRIYIFKDGKEIDVLELDGRSSFLVGRDRTVFVLMDVLI